MCHAADTYLSIEQVRPALDEKNKKKIKDSHILAH